MPHKTSFCVAFLCTIKQLMYYIIGLGNPGEKYADTRHNIGRMVVEEISGNNLSKDKLSNSLTSSVSLGGDAVQLFAPETFMNNSGETAKYIVDKLDAKVDELIVVHDDIDLPFGEIKIGKRKGAGGNNGIDSIIKHLGTKDFLRVRIGIAPTSFWTGKMKRPAGGGPLERFVLKPFTPGERRELPEVINKTAEAIETIITSGVERAMNDFN